MWPLRMVAVCSFKISGTTHPLTQQQILEDQNPELHSYENLKTGCSYFAYYDFLC